MPPLTLPVTVDVHLQPHDLATALRYDAATGLTSTPKVLPPKWFYDDRGSELFELITQQPEYYPTRREREVLEREAATIAAASGATTLVELGSGTSEKTLALLDAFTDTGQLRRFVPFDVSEGFLRESAATIAERYPGLEVRGIVGDFERHLHAIPGPDAADIGSGGDHRLVAFLGGTIGNLRPARRVAFLADLAATLDPGDTLLLGTDLVKDPARLVAAYDDAAGLTAEFNRNVLRVLNRELHADFHPDGFAHVALWDPDEEWIEMHLRAERAHTVHLRDLGLDIVLAAGEELHTEVSAKFRRQRVADELSAAGFELMEWWTDAGGDFGVSLARRR